MKLLTVLTWGLLSLSAHAQILLYGCNPLAVPGPVKNLNVVINRWDLEARLTW